jgi:hypothetical protein
MPAPLRYLLIIVTTGMLLYTVYRSWHFTKESGGTDLRCRVIGARLIPTDHSPYYYKWNPADGEYFLNPNDAPTRLVNGNVATPAMLYTIYPVSVPAYSVVRPLWTVLQYIACFALFFLLLYKQPRTHAIVSACIVIAGLVCTTTWQYGIERGQVYIFYALLFALMYRVYISRIQFREFLSGLIGGLFIFFRPFAGIIAVGFLLHGKKKWLLGWITGIILGTCTFVLPNTSLWKDYFSAMKEYTNESRGEQHVVLNAADPPKPDTIEGMNTLRSYRAFTAIEVSALYGYFAGNDIWINTNQSFFMYGCIVLLLSIFFLRSRKKIIEPQALFLFGFVLYMLAELFNIAPRASYNVIQWLFPLTIILLYIRPFTPLFMALAAAFLLLHAFPFRRFPYHAEITELIFFGVTIFFIFFPGIVKKWQYGISRA